MLRRSTLGELQKNVLQRCAARNQFVCGLFGNDAPCTDDRNPLAELFGFLQIVGRQEHRQPVGIELAQPLPKLDADIAKMRDCMEQASTLVLDGFKLRTEVDDIRFPNRYMSKKKGAKGVWDKIMGLL